MRKTWAVFTSSAAFISTSLAALLIGGACRWARNRIPKMASTASNRIMARASRRRDARMTLNWITCSPPNALRTLIYEPEKPNITGATQRNRPSIFATESIGIFIRPAGVEVRHLCEANSILNGNKGKMHFFASLACKNAVQAV